MRGRGFPWQRLLLVLLVFAAGFLLHDVRTHGSFQGTRRLRWGTSLGTGTALGGAPAQPCPHRGCEWVCVGVPGGWGLCWAGRSRRLQTDPCLSPLGRVPAELP